MDSPTSRKQPAPEIEYTISELAEFAGTTIRNIRAYQEKSILPPPEKRGRVGIYTENHLIRLRIIGQLLARGYSIANISEMLCAQAQGQDIHQLIGLNSEVAKIWPEEAPLYLTIEELSARFSTPPTAQDIQYAFEAGVLEAAPHGMVKLSHAGLLQLGATLIDYQFSFRQLLDIVATLRKNLDTAAIAIAETGLSILFPHERNSQNLSLQIDYATELVQYLNPWLSAMLEAELTNALARAIKQQMTQHMVNRVLKHAGDSPQ